MIVAAPEAAAPEAIGAGKSFGVIRALRGVKWQVANGQRIGRAGRNDAGQSTLASMLSGLLAADAGQVRFDGQTAPALKDMDLWRHAAS